LRAYVDGVNDEAPKVGEKKSILIVEGHPVVRERLTAVINAAPDLVVCGEAETAAQALDALPALKPDAVIVNFSIDGSVGLESIEALKSSHPELPVIASILHDEQALVEKALAVGAQGYITGRADAEGHSTDRDVVDSIRRVLAAA